MYARKICTTMLSKRQIQTTSRDNDYVSLALESCPQRTRTSSSDLLLVFQCSDWDSVIVVLWDQYDEHTETKYMPDLFNRFDLCLQYLCDTFNAPVGEIDAHYQLEP